MTTNNHYNPEYKDYHWTLSSFTLRECFWHFRYPGILSQYRGHESFHISADHGSVVAYTLVLFSAVTTIMDIITVATGGNPVALIIDVIAGLVNIGLTCIGDQSRDKPWRCIIVAISMGYRLLPLQFKRVEGRSCRRGMERRCRSLLMIVITRFGWGPIKIRS